MAWDENTAIDYPAHAGMTRSRTQYCPADRRFPARTGMAPHDCRSSRWRRRFPARTGMGPARGTPREAARGCPRTHGDRPRAQIAQITSENGVYWSFGVQMYADPSRNDPRGARSAGSTAGSTGLSTGVWRTERWPIPRIAAEGPSAIQDYLKADVTPTRTSASCTTGRASSKGPSRRSSAARTR